MKYRGIRSENNPSKSIKIEGYLYEHSNEKYIVPWENAVSPFNHMFLVEPDSVTQIQ